MSLMADLNPSAPEEIPGPGISREGAGSATVMPTDKPISRAEELARAIVASDDADVMLDVPDIADLLAIIDGLRERVDQADEADPEGWTAAKERWLWADVEAARAAAKLGARLAPVEDQAATIPHVCPRCGLTGELADPAPVGSVPGGLHEALMDIGHGRSPTPEQRDALAAGVAKAARLRVEAARERTSELMDRVRRERDELVLTHLTDAAQKIAPCPDTGVLWPADGEAASGFRATRGRWPLWWEMALAMRAAKSLEAVKDLLR